MPGALEPWIHLVGRILFGLLFVMSGMNHLTQREAMTQYARGRNLPAPGASVVLSGLVILVAGAMIVVGWYPSAAAGLLFLFLLTTAILMHPFWKERDPQTKQNEMIHFMKDLALAGAALIFLYYGGDPWPFSI